MRSGTDPVPPSDSVAAGALRRQIARGLGCAAVVAVADQASKWFIVSIVMDPPRVIEVLPFFNLVMVWNTGASFGLFGTLADSAWLLSGVAAAIIVALLFWLRTTQGWFLALAIGAVIGGATGNLLDRLRFGAVADFLDVHAAGWHWPAFNLADSAITVAVLMLLVDGLIGGRRSP